MDRAGWLCVCSFVDAPSAFSLSCTSARLRAWLLADDALWARLASQEPAFRGQMTEFEAAAAARGFHTTLADWYSQGSPVFRAVSASTASAAQSLHAAAALGEVGQVRRLHTHDLASAQTELRIQEKLWCPGQPFRGWVPKTALQRACECHQPRAVRALLALGDDPGEPSRGASNGCDEGHQAIHFACAGVRGSLCADQVDSVRALLEARVSPNTQSPYLRSSTPLTQAGSSNNPELIILLLAANADVNACRYNGGSGEESALYLAIASMIQPPFDSADTAVVELLIRHKADPSIGTGRFANCSEAIDQLASGNDPSNSEPWNGKRKYDCRYPPTGEQTERILSALARAKELCDKSMGGFFL